MNAIKLIIEATIMLVCGCNAILFHSHYPYGKNIDCFYIENSFLPDSLFELKFDTNEYTSPRNLLLRMREGNEKYIVVFNNHIGPTDEGFLHCCTQYYILIKLQNNKPIPEKSIGMLLDCEYPFCYWKPNNIIMTNDSLFFYGKKFNGNEDKNDSIRIKLNINTNFSIVDYKKQIEKCYKKT
jgi:hypothetical protein